MSKLVPSPDWFVGLDGLNLCENGKFVDSVTVEVHIAFYVYLLGGASACRVRFFGKYSM